MATASATVDEYVESFPEETPALLARVRSTLLAEVPGAEEKIRYGMPAVMLADATRSTTRHGSVTWVFTRFLCSMTHSRPNWRRIGRPRTR